MHPTFHTFAQAEETEVDVVKLHQLLTLHVNLRLVRSLLYDGMGVTDIFFQTYTPTGISFSFPFFLPPVAFPMAQMHFLSKNVYLSSSALHNQTGSPSNESKLSRFSTNLPSSAQLFSYQNSRRRHFR